MTIGERIRRARDAMGLTQKQLGAISGTSEITIRQYELGKRQPRLEQLQRIAFALETTVSDLVEPEYWSTVSKEEIDESWESNPPFYVSPELCVENIMKLMNKEGRRKVADYAADILPSYRKETTKRSISKDTTPAAGGPGTVPEGE